MLLNHTKYLALIVIVVTAVFFSHYRECLTRNVPLSYEGDSIAFLVRVQSFEKGDGSVLIPRCFKRLNAPENACWSDIPSEKITPWTAGQLSKILGLARGSDLTVLLLQILAGCSFYYCGMWMVKETGNRALLAACAILFGLAPYAFVRNLQHLQLTCFWQLPLFTLFLLWFGWRERVQLHVSEGMKLGIATGLIGGLLNPYYLGPFLVLLTLLVLGKIGTRDWVSTRIFILTLLSAGVGFVIQNMDTFLYAAAQGKNRIAVCRDLWWMVKFGLYLPDLFFPRAHRWEWFNMWSWGIYQGHVPEQLCGESMTSYIGMMPAFGLIILIISGVSWIAAQRYDKVSPYFWLSMALILFSLAGGVNYLLGAIGFQYLRAMDRTSIFLACFSLYFLCERLPVWVPSRIINWVALLIIPLGIWDQVPKYHSWEDTTHKKGWADFENDRKFFPKLEAMLPKGAMVFELPVKDYPEDGQMLKMGDYEHFRPHLHTEALRFSYGAVKGRWGVQWQKKCAAQVPEKMVEELVCRGFSAVLINKKAYEDSGEQWRQRMEALSMSPIMENHDFLIYRLDSGL